MSFDKVDAAILLAAGLSKRFGAENKLLAPWRGRALASYAFEAAAESALRKVFLITGQDGDGVAALAPASKFERVHNPDYLSGLASSLRAGLRAAPPGPVMVLLADMPLIGAALIDELCAAWRPGAYALAPSFNGEMGNPVILGEAARAGALTLSGDRSARKLFEGRTDVIRFPVSGPAILRDFDSAADFQDDAQ